MSHNILLGKVVIPSNVTNDQPIVNSAIVILALKTKREGLVMFAMGQLVKSTSVIRQHNFL